MARFEVNGKSVQGVDLLRRRYWASRLDFWPFLALYALWLLLAVPALDFTDAFIVLAAVSAAHILAFLFTAWSVDFRAFVGYSKVKDIHAANACKVTPAKFSGSKEIVPLHIQKTVASSSAAGETEEIYFDFRKQRFIYSAEKDNFFKLRYPTKELLEHYAKGTGYGTEAKINTAVDKWGRNIFEYPQPTFQKLMKEQCMEPFFVFQVFLRWSLVSG
uniref:P5A-ATPase transmembrane helical hairpin domain-containing protein n=1 Tax=Arundo donax TaxID=35708 RepID=A0A0A9CI02_ARUDO